MPTNKLPFRKAVGMNTLIREVLKEGRMAEAFNSRCIFRAWDLASGAAEFTVRRYFRDGKLYITLSSSVVRSQLHFQQDVLLQKINSIARNDEFFTDTESVKGPVTQLILK
ncbi:MAG: DUF721 domain-containing protein [Bacteroidales bacterium]|nr:DUF721 domain-containing protein [Bacteroidales bacterium]MDD6772595.1 DUF721 domain-containing protein [Bacteroidales bacterium]MDO4213745.1 DUF721 domain-containing protein [Bacteroidales bacterium]